MRVLGFTPQDAIQYINPNGDVFSFLNYCRDNHQRKGQAWYNALGDRDRNELNGSLLDPFFSDDWAAVLVALVYLMDPDQDQRELQRELWVASGREIIDTAKGRGYL